MGFGENVACMGPLGHYISQEWFSLFKEERRNVLIASLWQELLKAQK